LQNAQDIAIVQYGDESGSGSVGGTFRRCRDQ
jgi:hypothetical protein